MTNVCVVGGAGFLGSHLVHHLIEEKGYNVWVVDNLCVGRREYVHPAANFVHHDITGSEEFLFRLFKDRGIRYVYNYAAWPYIPISFSRPMHVFSVNATGAIKVINAAHAAACEAILQVSSAELYGSSMDGKLTEESEVAPHSTYGTAKAAVDYYCQCAWKERQTPVIALRQFNCVGERETHPYVIPEIISQLYKGRTVYLGNNSSRDFLYAGDAVAMAAELVEVGHYGEVYNMGSQETTQIYNLAQLLGQIIHGETITVEEDEDRKRPWEIWHLLSDNSKLYDVIKTRPKISLEMALAATVLDYEVNYKKWAWE